MKKLFIFCFSLLSMTLAYGQGFESFDNFPESGNSYADGTFAGQDGSTWTYVQCRGDIEITGKAIMIGRNRDPQSNFYSGSIANGLGTLSFDYQQAFSSNVNLNVLINDVVVGNVTSNGEPGITKNSGDFEVNVEGDFVIKFINVNNSDGQVVVDNLEWSAPNTNIVATPTFTPPGGIYNDPVDVEITCTTPEAEIYYTLDGSDPDENSTAYATAINITEATTLKALAYVWAGGLEPSAIAQADYSFATLTEVANLSELRAAVPGGTETFVVTGEVILTYKQDFRGQKYIQDAAAGILIDDYDGAITTEYTLGDGISGMTGTLSEYGGMLQFIPSMDPGAATSSGNQVEPVEITLAEMTSSFEDYEARLVKIPNVTFADQDSTFANGTEYLISDDSKAEGIFRTTFYDMDYIGTMVPAGAGDVIGILNSRTDGNYISSRSQADLMWGAVGEPSNYPIEFAAIAAGTNISLTWTDATGEVIPTGYLVLASDQDNISLPADGTPVFDDVDFSDGMGALNIPAGSQAASFAGLTESMTYYFKVFPFTNAGSIIDYKTDGTPPAAQATTEESSTTDILFTTFDNGWENWTRYSVTGDQVWDRDNTYGIEGTPCAKMSGYEGAAFDNEDWLISPGIDLSAFSNETFEFYSASAYTGPALEVFISTDYDGTGNPNDFTWNDFTNQAQWPADTSYFAWTLSGSLDISAYTDQTIFIAFKFNSTADGSATWEIDNVLVKEAEAIGEPTNYPTNFTASGGFQSVSISWTDAIGEVIPEGYLVLISDQEGFTEPSDGAPVSDDLDLSDGNGVLNVMPGVETISFSGLMDSTTYNTIIFPYTNSGADINYKTDFPPPPASATTSEAASDILFTTFDEGWENWTQLSVTGDQVWSRDNTYGIEGTPCAKMSGYQEGAFDNEDWLISPSIDLSNTIDETFEFNSASAYDGPDLEVFISTDYDGTGNPNDFTWDDFTNQAQWPNDTSFFAWTLSGSLDISAYTDQAIYIAFKFTSTTDGSATWEIDNVKVKDESNGIGENHLPLAVSLYPNPSTGMIYFNAEESVETIEVFNLVGMKVHQMDAAGFEGEINLTNFESGIYIVRLSSDEKVMTSRIIIQ